MNLMEFNEKETCVRNYFEAYRTKNRQLLESLLHPEFQFMSPIDDAISLGTYWSRCWPLSETTTDVQVLNLACDKDLVFCRYDMQFSDGKRFCNVDTFLVKNGQIIGQQSYFGDPPVGMTRAQFDLLHQEEKKAS